MLVSVTWPCALEYNIFLDGLGIYIFDNNSLFVIVENWGLVLLHAELKAANFCLRYLLNMRYKQKVVKKGCYFVINN